MQEAMPGRSRQEQGVHRGLWEFVVDDDEVGGVVDDDGGREGFGGVDVGAEGHAVLVEGVRFGGRGFEGWL